MTFEEIYYKYIDTVYSYINLRVKNKDLMEDIVQETFLAVYRNFEEIDSISSQKAWILKIANNKMIDKFRKSKDEISLDNNDYLINDHFHDEDHDVFIKELFQRIDETAQKILYGIYIEGLTYGELSEILCIPEGTVKSKCYYAKKRLKNIFREKEEKNEY